MELPDLIGSVIDVITPANTRMRCSPNDDPAGQMKHYLLPDSYSHRTLFDQFNGLECHQPRIAVMLYRHHQRVNDDILDRDTHLCSGIDELAREK